MKQDNISFEILENLTLNELCETNFDRQQDIFEAIKLQSVRYKLDDSEQSFLPDERVLVDMLNQVIIESINDDLCDLESLIGYSIAQVIIMSNNSRNYKFHCFNKIGTNRSERDYHIRNILGNVSEILFKNETLLHCQSILDSINELIEEPLELYFGQYLYQEIQNLISIKRFNEYKNL
jgi:hypothetical protein